MGLRPTPPERLRALGYAMPKQRPLYLSRLISMAEDGWACPPRSRVRQLLGVPASLAAKGYVVV
jgi:hypothetical protein